MSDPREPRIPPLPEREWNDVLADSRTGLEPVLNIHRVLAHHPELLAAWAPLRHHIAAGGSLSPRYRELLILRVAHRADSDYEWHHHVMRGRAAGLADDEIEAMRAPSPVGRTEEETTLLVATDELFEGFSLSEPTWEALRAAFTTQQILDLIFTVGVYVTLGMVIGATGVPIES